MNRPRILIVEDEVVVTMDLGQQVLALGYEPVAETRMGEEAILLAGQLQPDLVLMDITWRERWTASPPPRSSVIVSPSRLFF